MVEFLCLTLGIFLICRPLGICRVVERMSCLAPQIQVIEDDKTNRGGLFQTSGRGMVPPLVTTNIITEDQGGCHRAVDMSAQTGIG